MIFLRFIGGAVIGLGMLCGGIYLEGGHVSAFLQLASFVIVAGGTLGYLIASFPLAVQRRSIALAFNNEAGQLPELQIAKKYFEVASNGIRAFGLVGAIAGIIHVMENLDKPAQIGPGIAVAFICTLYSYLLPALTTSPMADMIGRKLDEHSLAQKVVVLNADSITSQVSEVPLTDRYAKHG